MTEYPDRIDLWFHCDECHGIFSIICVDNMLSIGSSIDIDDLGCPICFDKGKIGGASIRRTWDK